MAGRGKGKKTIIREYVETAVAASQGAAIATEKAKAKIEEKKPFSQRIKELMLKMGEKIDPLELGAIVGVTLIVHGGIEWGEQSITAKILATPTAYGWLLLPFWSPVGTALLEGLSLAGLQNMEKADIQKLLESPNAELIEWVVSFCVAYLIVRHFGEIVRALQGLGTNLASNLGITSLAKGLLGFLP